MWRKLSFIAFFVSLTLMVMVYLRFNPLRTYVSELLLIFGMFVMGLLGFIFSVVSIFEHASRKKIIINREKTIFFHLGMVLVFFSIVFRLLNWPFTNYFAIAGLIFIGISLLLKKNKPLQNDDILDG